MATLTHMHNPMKHPATKKGSLPPLSAHIYLEGEAIPAHSPSSLSFLPTGGPGLVKHSKTLRFFAATKENLGGQSKRGEYPRARETRQIQVGHML